MRMLIHHFREKIMTVILCGVGSRETPEDVIEKIHSISCAFSAKGALLRSGGAKGADQAFEEFWGDNKEIFLPWDGYEGRWVKDGYIVPKITKAHVELASSLHPAWDRCKQGAQKMHTRNTCQVLGENLKTPATLLVCWTDKGLTKGGTATAIRLAERNNIPVFNLGSIDGLLKLRKFYDGLYI